MSVQRYDSPLRFLVDSRSNPDDPPYLVEIDAYDGNGRCTCMNFCCRYEPKLSRGEALPGPATRCKHITAARLKFVDDMIALIKARKIETGMTKKEAFNA
jgi:hypothetical protein